MWWLLSFVWLESNLIWIEMESSCLVRSCSSLLVVACACLMSESRSMAYLIEDLFKRSDRRMEARGWLAREIKISLVYCITSTLTSTTSALKEVQAEINSRLKLKILRKRKRFRAFTDSALEKQRTKDQRENPLIFTALSCLLWSRCSRSSTFGRGVDRGSACFRRSAVATFSVTVGVGKGFESILMSALVFSGNFKVPLLKIKWPY